MWRALSTDCRLVFVNFEDFDMLYGHRNDTAGFAKSLEEFDVVLGKLLSSLRDDDLLIMTADHGNDPTTPSTDHTREYVPVCVVGKGLQGKPLGDIDGFTAVAQTIAQHLSEKWPVGVNLLA